MISSKACEKTTTFNKFIYFKNFDQKITFKTMIYITFNALEEP